MCSKRFFGDFLWRRIVSVDWAAASNATIQQLLNHRDALVSVEYFNLPYLGASEAAAEGRRTAFELLRHLAPQIRSLFFDVEGYSMSQLTEIINALSPTRLERLEIGCPSEEFIDLFLQRKWPCLKHIGYVPSVASLQNLAERTGALTSISLWTARVSVNQTRLCVKTIPIVLSTNPNLRKIFLASTPFFFEVGGGSDDIIDWPNVSDPEDDNIDGNFQPLVKRTFRSPSSWRSGVWFSLMLPGDYLKHFSRLPQRWLKRLGFPLSLVRFDDHDNAWSAQMDCASELFDRQRCMALYKACCDDFKDDETDNLIITIKGTMNFLSNALEPNAQWCQIVAFCAEQLDSNRLFVIDSCFDWITLQTPPIWLVILSACVIFALNTLTPSETRVRVWFRRLIRALDQAGNSADTICAIMTDGFDFLESIFDLFTSLEEEEFHERRHFSDENIRLVRKKIKAGVDQQEEPVGALQESVASLSLEDT